MGTRSEGLGDRALRALSRLRGSGDQLALARSRSRRGLLEHGEPARPKFGSGFVVAVAGTGCERGGAQASTMNEVGCGFASGTAEGSDDRHDGLQEKLGKIADKTF